MRHWILISIFLLLPHSPSLALPQQAPAGVNPRGIVESAEISGAAADDVSGDLRKAAHNLEGKLFDANSADELIVRIQAEHPTLTATVRLAEGSQANLVKVLFLIEKNAGQPGAESNVNSRYIVERVDVQGFDQAKLSQTIRDEMLKLVGEKLDLDKAAEILNQINRALQPKYSAVKKVTKGSDPQHIVVIYEVRKERLIPFIAIPSQRIVYHSKQNFSFDLNVPIDMGHNNRIFFAASDDQDELIERFAGFNFGFESTSVGTGHLGLALRYARYHERWQQSTVALDANSIYRERNTFAPGLTFAFNPRLKLTAGVDVSELQIQYPAVHRANSNAAVASLVFHDVWSGAGEDRHVFDAGYEFRAGNHSFDSDFIYTRHLIRAKYAYSHGKDTLLLSFLGGTISGNAPIFDRFSLGDASTLRGWNKFDIAPAGGNRVVHTTVQYRFGKPGIGDFNIDNNGIHRKGHFGLGFHVFYDAGAVGNSGSPIQARHSAGFGIGSTDDFFMELGFPIRSNRVAPTFSMGFRF